jgi:hypothetical protein
MPVAHDLLAGGDEVNAFLLDTLRTACSTGRSVATPDRPVLSQQLAGGRSLLCRAVGLAVQHKTSLLP